MVKDTMTETLEARWQDKGKQDRSKDAGAWVCPTCGQRLATVRLNYCENTRMCGATIHDLALLMPLHIDQGDPGRGRYFSAGQHFEKRHHRHARRLTHAINEVWTFQGLKEQSLEEAGLMKQYAADGESLSDFRTPETIQSSINWAEEETKTIRHQREPDAPTVVTPDKLPITVKCPRPGCERVSAIRAAVAGETATRVAENQARHTARTKTLLGVVPEDTDADEWNITDEEGVRLAFGRK